MPNPHLMFEKYKNSVFLCGHIEPGIITSPSQFQLQNSEGDHFALHAHGTAFLVSINNKANKGLFATCCHVLQNIPNDEYSKLCLTAPPVHDLISNFPVQQYIHPNYFTGFNKYDDMLACEKGDWAFFTLTLPDTFFAVKRIPITFSYIAAIGDQVITLGFPYSGYSQQTSGYQIVPRLTSAYISTICSWKESICVEIDNFIAQGNSGGPLINCRTGHAIGIIRERRLESQHFADFKIPSFTTYSYATYVHEFSQHDFPPNIEDMLKIVRPK